MKALTFANHEFEGKNNAYLLNSGDTITLVDTGLATPAVREEFVRGLNEENLGFADIDQILLTHWHPDHTGLVGEIQAQSGATVYLHEKDRPLVMKDDDALGRYESLSREQYDDWSIPQTQRDKLEPHTDFGALISSPESIEPISDGDTIDVGDRELTVLDAAGHTAGHCCFSFETDTGREAFVGDAILPKYTPNVGGTDVRIDEPLRKYISTLERLADQEFTRLWPGHRFGIENPTERAEEIIDHHRERTNRIIDFLREEGPTDTWTVSAHLFGELEEIHILHGPGEAHAHLDHLEWLGIVDRSSSGYRLVDEGAAPDLFR